MIEPGEGLWAQIQKKETKFYKPLTEESFRDHMWDFVYPERVKLLSDVQVLSLNNVIDRIEKQSLIDMIRSQDVESVELARQLIETKIKQ